MLTLIITLTAVKYRDFPVKEIPIIHM